FFSSRRRHTRSDRDWSSDVCSSDLGRHRRFRNVLLELCDQPNGYPKLPGEFLAAQFASVTASAALRPRLTALKALQIFPTANDRSEERRVGKECRYRR